MLNSNLSHRTFLEPIPTQDINIGLHYVDYSSAIPFVLIPSYTEAFPV